MGNDLKKQIDEIRKLEPGWYDNAEPPTISERQEHSMEAFWVKCQELDCPGFILVPGTNGAFQMEWHYNNDLSLEVESTEDGKWDCYLKVPTGESESTGEDWLVFRMIEEYAKWRKYLKNQET